MWEIQSGLLGFSKHVNYLIRLFLNSRIYKNFSYSHHQHMFQNHRIAKYYQKCRTFYFLRKDVLYVALVMIIVNYSYYDYN